MNPIEVQVSGGQGIVPSTYKTIVLKPNIVNGKNMLTQAMFAQTDIKYVIKYDYIIDDDIVTENVQVLSSNISQCVNPAYAKAFVAYNEAHDAWIDADNAYTNNPNDTTLAAKNAAYAAYTAAQTALNNTPQYYYYAAKAISVHKGQHIIIPDTCVLLNSSLNTLAGFEIAPVDSIVYIGSLIPGTYEYTVQEAIQIPARCFIEFDGGFVSNGTIEFNNTILIYNQQEEDVLKNITMVGDYEVSAGGKGDKKDNINGMGKIYLKKNKGFAEQLTQDNTIYVIQYDFDLDEEEVNIPENCVLEFDGGRLEHGTIVFNNTEVIFKSKCIALDCNIAGTVTNNRIPIDVFITDYSDCTAAFTKLIDFLELGNGGQILLSAKTYTVSSINLGIKTSIIGCGYGSSIIRTNVTTETEGGIINIPRSTTCCTIYGVSIVGSQIINGNVVANQNIDGINVALTHGISGDTLYSRDGNFENETTEEDFNRVASYKNITIDNVYVGHCRNGIVIYRHGFRTNIINSEIKFNYEDGIKCHATDNIFYNLYVEGNGKNGINYTDNSGDNKISNIKSIFNGNSDPKNCYAYRINSSTLLVNCESQDNACSGFLLASDSNQLINCTSYHDCLTDTGNIHYDASKELVGFRIAGPNNILKMCSILSHPTSDRTYHKFYEVLDALNIVDIKIPTEIYMDNNPVNSLVRVPTNLGNVQDLLSDEGGIYISSSRLTVLQKKIVLPGVFMYVVDVDIPTLEEIEGVNGNYPQIMDIAGIRSQIFTSEDNVVIATVGENFKKNGESIIINQTNPISIFDFSNEIRIAVMVDCINKKIYSYYSFKVADAGWIAIGRTFKEFDTYTPLQLTATIGDNFNKTSFKSDLRIKRFAIGYDPDASFETLSRLGMPILMSQNFMSYDYANEVAIEGSSLSTNGTVRPTSPIGGQMFFDKNLNKPVWWTGITELGDNGWVDALGNHPDTVYPKVIGTPTAGNLAKFNSTDSHNIEDAGVAPQVE